jgi:fumarylacetoacetase
VTRSDAAPRTWFEADETHDINARSWVESANGHTDFPLQNLPFGIFNPGEERPRSGVAIGGEILDLPAVLRAGLLSGETKIAAAAASGPHLNGWLGLPSGPRRALPTRISRCEPMKALGRNPQN